MKRALQRTATENADSTAPAKDRLVALGMNLEELRELEAKAMQLEKLAKMLLNTPQQAFYLYDYRAQEFLFGQAHLSGLYGYKTGEIEKRKDGWLSIVHPDDLAEYLETRERMIRNPKDEVCVLRMRTLKKSGGWEWITSYRRVFERDEKGAAVSEIGMGMIITPLVEAETALKETEALCHSLFQFNTAGVLVFDPKFQITDANPAVRRMLDYDAGELSRLGVLDLTAPGTRMEMHRLLRVMKSGDKKLPPSLDAFLEHKTGTKVAVMATPTCIHDEKGGFRHGMLILANITDRKLTEAALKRESELNRILIDNAPIAIGLLSPEGTVLRMNAVAEKLFGYTMKELKDREVWELPIMNAEEKHAAQQRFQSLLDGADKVTAAFPIRTRRGETRHIESTTMAVTKPDGSIDCLITTGTDMTERRQLEAEVIRVAEQEHIRIGHDLHDGIGQTLTGIASLVEALESKLQGEDKKDAKRIYELVKTATEETRRLSHGLSPAAVKNRGLAGGLLLIAETVRENFRRDCVCQIDDPAPRVDQEAEIHLFRIAQEAVNNAIRHGGATKLRISLRHKSSTRGLLEISDNGPGFPDGKISSTGDGIGLRVMEHRAHLINGELKIQTVRSKGVRVTCQFPLRSA